VCAEFDYLTQGADVLSLRVSTNHVACKANIALTRLYLNKEPDVLRASVQYSVRGDLSTSNARMQDRVQGNLGM
jgi:hypothetical protein